MTVPDVLAGFVRHPYRTLVRRWNWKAALLSGISRSTLFFLVNLPAGGHAARQAFVTELVYRGMTAGFYGAMTQGFRHASPPLLASVTVMLLLPAVSHSIEACVHALRGTPNLAGSITASVLFTIASTAFNLFAMRRGAFIVGSDRESLGRDLRRMPALGWAFVVAIVKGLRMGRGAQRAGRYLERSSAG